MGSNFKVDADTETYDIKMKWTHADGEKLKAPLKLTLKKNFRYLPCLRRHATKDGMFKPMFLCLEPKGIEHGSYSHLQIFSHPISAKEGWGNVVEIEGWNGYKNIKKMTFVKKDKSEIVITHKGDVWQQDKDFTIDPKNPIVEIIVE